MIASIKAGISVCSRYPALNPFLYVKYNASACLPYGSLCSQNVYPPWAKYLQGVRHRISFGRPLGWQGIAGGSVYARHRHPAWGHGVADNPRCCCKARPSSYGYILGAGARPGQLRLMGLLGDQLLRKVAKNVCTLAQLYTQMLWSIHFHAPAAVKT